MREAHSRLGPDGQCASLAGSRGFFRKKGLRGSVAAHPRGDWCVQPVACKEDRAFPRDLLKRAASAGLRCCCTHVLQATMLSLHSIILDPSKATAAELRGQEIFFGKGQCGTCHTAPYYTDNLMHDLKTERFFKPVT